MRRKSSFLPALLLAVVLPASTLAQSSLGERYAQPPGPSVVRPFGGEPRVQEICGCEFGAGDRPSLRGSMARLTVGPHSSFTNHGAHFGALAAVDLGRGHLGGRLSASWARSFDDVPATSSVSQFVGELTLDPLEEGVLHPVFGLGLGLLYAQRGEARGFAGVGTLRAGLEAALPVRDVDVRVGVAVQGGLLGPSEAELGRMRGLANVLATFSLGF